MSKVVSGRVPDELADWLDAYAKERGVTRAAMLASAIEALRGDAAGGVPEVLDAKSPADGRGKVSRPVVPAVPGVVRGSEVRAPVRCPSCGGRAFPMGGFQHKRTCPGYSRV
jgi:hypothetical protein